MKYKFKNWNNKQGTVPVFWKPSDYLDVEWYRHQDKTHGFTTNHKNYAIYGENLGVFIPKTLPKVFESISEFFDLKELVYSLSKYEPGMLLPWHFDNYPTYSRNKNVSDISQIVRVMVFLQDSEPGHQLWLEDNFCYGPAGSWFSWEGQTNHMAANLSETDRHVLQITGIKI
jgi:hypothetical protein